MTWAIGKVEFEIWEKGVMVFVNFFRSIVIAVRLNTNMI